MCPNGTLHNDGAWYAVCKCYGADGCFVTYESIGTYQCQDEIDPVTQIVKPGERYEVVTAIGRTKRACGKIGLKRTVEIYKTLAPQGQETNYTWNPGVPGGDPTPGDQEIGKLDLGLDQKPDQTTKKIEEAKTEQQPEKTTPNSSTGGGTGTGKTEKHPKKSVTRTHRRAAKTNTVTGTHQDGGEGLVVFGIGGLGRLGGGRGHGEDHRDHGRDR